MINMTRIAGLLLIVLATAGPLRASDPAIQGDVNGLELCPQFICGSAIFSGVFRGTVDGDTAYGTWWATVQHQPLPDLGDPPVQVLGGDWSLKVWVFRGFFPKRQTYQGVFQPGSLGAIEGNFFRVLVPMQITRSGSGQIDLDLLLDENSIPQPVTGTLTQPSTE